MNDSPQQPPSEPASESVDPVTGDQPEAAAADTQPAPPPQQQTYTPPPLPPGYEQHYRPIYQQPQPKGPSNDSAVASIIVACASLGFLFISAGLLAPLTLVASAIAIPLGHKGKENVDHGKTKQNRDIAVAGFWTGIAGVALSLIAIIAWVIVIVVIATSGDITWTDDNGDFHRFNFNE